MSRCCAEPTCNQPLPSKLRPEQRFCPGGKCRRKYQHRALGRAVATYEVLMKWRRTRGRKTVIGGRGRLGDMSVMVDRWIREDREMRERAVADR